MSTMLSDARGQWRTWLEVSLTVLLILTCGSVLWRLQHPVLPPPTHIVRPPPPPEPPVPPEPISIVGAPVQGDASAKTIVIIFSDFQCPYCGRFARETLPVVEERYLKTGKIRIVFESLPLDMHPFAFGAAVAAECAGQQGKFWQMHDAMFADQQGLDNASLRAKAVKLGVDVKKFDACVANPETAGGVRGAVAGAKALSISGTPTFFVGTMQTDGRVRVNRRLPGAMTVPQFESLLTAAGVATTVAVARPGTQR